MSKQAKMFQDLLNVRDKMLKQIEAEYYEYLYLLSDDEILVIQAMLALAED